MIRQRRMMLAALGMTVVMLIVVVAIIKFFSGREAASATTNPADAEAPVATVQTVPLQLGDIRPTVTAYGSVTADPASIAIYAVPIEVQVGRVLVSAGQAVAAGGNLLDVSPSPDAKQQLLDAANAAAAAEKDLQGVQQRFDLKLATNADLLAAKQALQSAQSRLQNLQQRGAGDAITRVIAAVAGVIGKIDVQQGQLVPAGAPLIEVVPAGRIEVTLGVEPGNTGALTVGQAVHLFPATRNAAAAVEGTLKRITRQVNASTRLVDVVVEPADRNGLLLGSFVRGEFAGAAAHGLIVPPAALTSGDDGGDAIFILKDGHALRRAIKVGVRTDDAAQITGEQLAAGDAVVTVGNLELEDGMAATPEAAR